MAPVTKQSVMSTDNQLLLEAYNIAENKINSTLISFGSGNFYLDDILKGKAPLRNQVVQMIKSAYEKAGWKVERIQGSDFRESWDYLSIS